MKELFFILVNDKKAEENWFFMFDKTEIEYAKKNNILKDDEIFSLEDLKKDLKENKNHHLYVDYLNATEKELEYLKNNGILLEKKF